MQRFLIVMMALSATICVGAQDYDFSAKNSDSVIIYYNIISEEEQTCEVTKGSYVDAVNIPTYAMGNKVVSIGEGAFSHCSQLTL